MDCVLIHSLLCRTCFAQLKSRYYRPRTNLIKCAMDASFGDVMNNQSGNICAFELFCCLDSWLVNNSFSWLWTCLLLMTSNLHPYFLFWNTMFFIWHWFEIDLFGCFFFAHRQGMSWTCHLVWQLALAFFSWTTKNSCIKHDIQLVAWTRNDITWYCPIWIGVLGEHICYDHSTRRCIKTKRLWSHFYYFNYSVALCP